MKKRILSAVLGVGIVAFSIIIGISYNYQDEKKFEQDNVKYAINLDGEKVSSFPAKGMYQVDVTCEGVTGKWIYDEWKLSLENITSNMATCDVNFTTISKTYLNNYVASLVGQVQGDGQVVTEGQAVVPDLSVYTALPQNNYTNIQLFSSDTVTSSSGSPVTNTFYFSGNDWVTSPGNMISGTYYHMKFNPAESGYYRVCYNVGYGWSMNQTYVYKNDTTRLISDWPDDESEHSKCADIGYVSSNDTISFVEFATELPSYPIGTLRFRLEKSLDDYINIGTRYEGKNPNNYSWFNDELWRIVGVFDEDNHGVSGENLVKIVRAYPLGSLAVNSTSLGESALIKLLNDAYYNKSDGTGDNCIGYSNLGLTNIPTNCDYSATGINTTYRSMIRNVTWYYGGLSLNNNNAEILYGAEHGLPLQSGNPWSFQNNIGLLNASDFAFSVLSSVCDRSMLLSNYSTNNCMKESWLRGMGDEWTMTPSNSVSLFYISGSGGILTNVSNNGLALRPALYLNSSVYLIDGSGTIADPYIIGM